MAILSGERFRVDRRMRGGEMHLRVGGDLDFSTSMLLDGSMIAAEGVDSTAIVMDLKGVTFMDSAGLRSILRAAERADLCGSGFSVVNAPAVVRRVMEVCGTGSLLDRTGAERR